ncbi:MAG TPA: hypothetical protein VGI40_22800 [Pirellulaceae bacterium]|jgi:hypothetical protein
MLKRSLVAACLSVSLFAGCDLSGEYDKKVQTSLQSAGQRAVFDLNLHSTFTEVVDSAKQNVGVKLRLPKVFDANSKALAPDKSPIKLPGLAYVLERQLDDDSGKFLPAYVVFAVVPKTETKADALQNTLLQTAKTIALSAAWSDVNLPTPTGQSLALKRLRAEGKLPAGKKAAPTETHNDIYLIDAGANNVVIAWVMPKAQAQKYHLETATDTAMGTLENTAPPAGPGGKAAPAGKAATGCF